MSIIGAAHEHDLGEISILWKSSLQAPWSLKMIQDSFRMPCVYTAVARASSQSGKKIQGFIMGSFGEEGEIYGISVWSMYQGKGIGHLLLKAYCSYVKEKGGRSIFLEVSEYNQSALSFYEQEGFQCIAQRNNYYIQTLGINTKTSHHGLVLQKIL